MEPLCMDVRLCRPALQQKEPAEWRVPGMARVRAHSTLLQKTRGVLAFAPSRSTSLCPAARTPPPLTSSPSSALRTSAACPPPLSCPHSLQLVTHFLPTPPSGPSRPAGHPLPLTMSDNQSEQTRETIEAFEVAEAKKKTDEKRDLKYDSHRAEPGAASYDGKKHMDTPAEDHVWGFTPSKHGAAAEEKKKERQAEHRARSHHSNTNTVEIPGFTAPARK